MATGDQEYDTWLKERGGGAHYYGDSIRKHFLLAGIFLILLIPIDRDLLSFYLTFGIVFVVFTIILAGLTNPKSQSIIIADLLLALVLGCVFEYLATSEYFQTSTIFNMIFILRQLIAAVGFGALYLSTKTLRGMFYKNKN